MSLGMCSESVMNKGKVIIENIDHMSINPSSKQVTHAHSLSSKGSADL